MAGLSDAQEVSVLNTLFNQSLYLRLLTSTVAGTCMNDNGTFPAGLAEVSTGGYSPLLVTAAKWNSAVAGSPSYKTVPNSANSPLQFTPSGASWNLTAYAWTTDNSTITSSNFISGGVFVDSGNNPIVYPVLAGQPFQITDSYPIVERLGDAPSGVNPT